MGSDLLLETYLKRLRLPTVAANYRRFAQEATHGNQPYERYLLALLETEGKRYKGISAKPGSALFRVWVCSHGLPQRQGSV